MAAVDVWIGLVLDAETLVAALTLLSLSLRVTATASSPAETLGVPASLLAATVAKAACRG
jgi:hypothetical protein